MARTDSHWEKTIGGYLKAAYNVLLSGASRYLNFGTVSGASGYGIRDNAGTMEFKDSGGSWQPFISGGAGITTEQAVDAVATQIAAGSHTGISITYNDAGDAISFALTDEIFTSAMKTKVNHLTVTGATDLDTIRTKVANVPADTNSELAAKADSSSLATVATTGAYSDLSGTPDLSVYDNFETAADSGSFPATGDADVLYLETNTGLLYRWNGASYSIISAQLALGETSSTAYRGDRGKTAYDHSQVTTGNPHSVTKSDVGLGNVDNTSDTNKPVSTAQQAALDNKLDIDLSLPSSDHTAVGAQTDAINAGATIAIGEVVYLASDGEWALADASATGTAEAMLGIALAAGSDGAAMLTALAGSFVRDDTWNWTVGAKLYLSETAGDLTETAPSTTDSVVRVVGYAVTADIVYLMPQQGVIHA